MIYRVTKIVEFDAAHHLPNYEGKCKQHHGHHWRVEVTLRGLHLNNKEVLMDFAEMKDMLVECVIKPYDHKDLNDIFSMPTAEIIARTIFMSIHTAIRKGVESGKYRVEKVRVWETPTSYAEVCEE